MTEERYLDARLLILQRVENRSDHILALLTQVGFHPRHEQGLLHRCGLGGVRTTLRQEYAPVQRGHCGGTHPGGKGLGRGSGRGPPGRCRDTGGRREHCCGREAFKRGERGQRGYCRATLH